MLAGYTLSRLIIVRWLNENILAFENEIKNIFKPIYILFFNYSYSNLSGIAILKKKYSYSLKAIFTSHLDINVKMT